MDNDLLSSTQKIGIIKPLRVSVSGIDVRKEVVDKLESLNLDYSAQFDRDCSFLVASSVVSDKYVIIALVLSLLLRLSISVAFYLNLFMSFKFKQNTTL